MRASGPVDLVDHEDHRQPGLQRLAQHEPRLGERALGGIDEQQHPVDHRQPALHFSAEVGVAGGVDDVELHVAVAHGGVLGEDRDPLLALEVHRVHHPLGDGLVVAEGARLPQQGVDERRLAVVDVGDDRHIADVGAHCHTGDAWVNGPGATVELRATWVPFGHPGSSAVHARAHRSSIREFISDIRDPLEAERLLTTIPTPTTPRAISSKRTAVRAGLATSMGLVLDPDTLFAEAARRSARPISRRRATCRSTPSSC